MPGRRSAPTAQKLCLFSGRAAGAPAERPRSGGSPADISLRGDAAANSVRRNAWPPLRSAGAETLSLLRATGWCAVGEAPLREKPAAHEVGTEDEAGTRGSLSIRTC